MSTSNFCKNCGARLKRNGWRSWIRGALCEDCALRLGSMRVRPIAAVVLLAVAAFAFGRYLRPAPPPLIIQRAANSPLSDLPVDPDSVIKAGASTSTATNRSIAGPDDVVYLCGARTKKGTPCRRRVHIAGERCYQHKGMPAMVPLEKLIVK